jgi:uncharacterized protein YkwD
MLPLLAAVCVLAIVSAVSVPAQSKATSKSKTVSTSVQQSGKIASNNEVTPNNAAASKSATAVSNAFLSPLEREIFDEMNLARTDPQKYATFVEEFKKYYKGNQITLPGRSQAIVTNEGTSAVDEAISFLRGAKPLPAMATLKGLCQAAKDQANDLALKGITGHKGSDGSTPNARLERYGMWDGVVGENIVYDVSTARQIVIGLIIDDGTANRGHRRNIFDPNHRLTGVSVINSSTNGAKCVITYVGGYTEKAATTSQR